MSQAVQSVKTSLEGALMKMTGRLTVKTQTAWKIKKKKIKNWKIFKKKTWKIQNLANWRGSDLLSSKRLSSPFDVACLSL